MQLVRFATCLGTKEFLVDGNLVIPVNTDIGEKKREIHIEPLEIPVPSREAPAPREEPQRAPEPVREPEKVPAR